MQYRFDFWLDSNASSDACKVNACELHWTQNQTIVEIHPPPGRPVDPAPLFDTTANTCTATRIPGGSPDGGPTEVTSDGCPTTGDAGSGEASAPDAGLEEAGAPLSVSSPALAPGAAFAKDNTCAGLDVSPPLSWSGAPAGTQGYAVVLENLTTGEIDWAIWDIPASTTSLPQIVAWAPYPMQPPGLGGAQQALVDGAEAVASQEATYGYVGPCPQGVAQSYRFTVYAVDAASVPGVTFESALPAVQAAVAQHALASGALGGTSNATLRANP
jgi:Raf kinase inhibitor-like YbhB/YbcL family protein